MSSITLTGCLNMLHATIDWRDETARCVGVFRSDDAAALEVEYKVHLDRTMLDLLARGFLKAGVPVLRGSEASLPKVILKGDTLSEHVPADPAPIAAAPKTHEEHLPSYAAEALPPVKLFNMDGTVKSKSKLKPKPDKVDRRRTWRQERAAQTPMPKSDALTRVADIQRIVDESRATVEMPMHNGNGNGEGTHSGIVDDHSH